MIGIFGGTFDPVHFGHIRPAVDVMQQLALDELRFIPCSVPAHRDAPVASAEQRLAMLTAALQDYPQCKIDQRELNRKGVSYMVDTLQSFRDEESGRTLCLIIGMDAFYGLHQWHHWQRLFELANIAVTYRPGHELNVESLSPQLRAAVEQRQVNSKDSFLNKQSGAIIFMPVTQLDISATAIRNKIAKQQPITDMLPVAVNNIIQQQHIYAG